MPYFVYKIGSGVTALVKSLEPVAKHETYKEAKANVKELRASSEAGSEYKVVFAQNNLEAEEMLSEQRDKPILAEWEK